MKIPLTISVAIFPSIGKKSSIAVKTTQTIRKSIKVANDRRQNPAGTNWLSSKSKNTYLLLTKIYNITPPSITGYRNFIFIFKVRKILASLVQSLLHCHRIFQGQTTLYLLLMD